MERCTTCGARLRPGLEWCWQCYTPLAANAPATAEAAGPSPAGLAPKAGENGQGPQETLARLLLGSSVEEMPMELLRGSADPAPVGGRVKRVTTGIVVSFAVGTDLLFLPNVRLVAFYAVFTGCLSAYVLKRLWSPHRRVAA